MCVCVRLFVSSTLLLHSAPTPTPLFILLLVSLRMRFSRRRVATGQSKEAGGVTNTATTTAGHFNYEHTLTDCSIKVFYNNVA